MFRKIFGGFSCYSPILNSEMVFDKIFLDDLLPSIRLISNLVYVFELCINTVFSIGLISTKA